MRQFAVVLTALYLRGAPRAVDVRRSAWPQVLKTLRRSCSDVSNAPDSLRDAGFWAEALLAGESSLLRWAERQVDSGRVLTAVDSEYPYRWVRVMGGGAPPALWRLGEVPPLPSVGIVGSRNVGSAITRFCFDVAHAAVEAGFCVVSGRAEGCDRAAARGAGSALIEIVPYGVAYARGLHECILSVCAPEESFSSATAMERNALIYAASSHTVVGHARFKEGGTWHGAVHAVRSRLSSLLLRASDDPASRALAALGGGWLAEPGDLALALKGANPQGQLFDQAV